MSPLRRNLEDKIEALLKVFPVVLLIGARQVGKTTLAKRCRPHWKYFDLEKGSDYDFITRDFDFFFREYSQEVIIDEAQNSPQLFRELRGVIDEKRDLKNRYILTGSSSSELLKEATDSLPGRMAIVEVGTMKVNELAGENLSDFYRVFENKISTDSIEELKSLKASKTDYLSHMLRGTYPEPALMKRDLAYFSWMENYHQSYIERDVRKLFPKLDMTKYRRLISMLSSLSGTVINKAQLGRSIDASEVSVRDYLEIAYHTFIWRTLPSYEKSQSKSIIKMPKGHFRDTGLIHYLNNVTNRDQMITHPRIGAVFESFVIEEIIKGARAKLIPRFEPYYYRTRGGAEIDLVLEGSFGLLPIEIKFGSHTSIKQLTSLKSFVDDHSLPFGIVINNSQEVRLITDKIVEIPISVL